MDKNEIRLSQLWTNHKSTNDNQQSSFFDGSNDLIKSRFFTILVFTLIFIVSLNLILSLWIIHSLQIANGGLGDGNLLTTIKRMTVKGHAKFNGWLTAEEINPVHRDQWLSIVGSDDQIQLVDYDQGEHDETKSNGFTMNKTTINYQGPNLIVKKLTNTSKETQFSINSNQLTTDSVKELKSTDWGLVVNEVLETTSIKGDHHHDLRLESRMKGLTMEAKSENLTVRSKVGEINMNSLVDLSLSAIKSIEIDSSRIQFRSLIKRHRHNHHNQHSDNGINQKGFIGYHLCTCENGRLFLAHGDKSCYLSPKKCSSNEKTEENKKTE